MTVRVHAGLCRTRSETHIVGFPTQSLISFQTGKMKNVLALCLAIYFVATLTEASRHPSSAPRSFKAFLEAKIRRISDEVVDLKQEVEDCCNKAGSLRFSLPERAYI